MTISAEGLVWAAIVLLYIGGGLAARRLPLWRMGTAYRRLAIALLLAQMLILAQWQNLESPSRYWQWLWDVEGEGNIPATLAAIQLAATGLLALVAARLSPKRPRWLGMYRLGVGLLFLYLALDEYLSLHEAFDRLELAYIVLGALTAGATALLAVTAPKREAGVYVAIIAGLALSGLGGLALDKAGPICGHLGPLRLGGCLFFFPIEEAFEYFGVWLALTGVLCWLAEAAPSPPLRARGFLYALPGFVALFFFLLSFAPRIELRLLAAPASAKFASGVSLLGYRIDHHSGSTQVRLYASAAQSDYMGAGWAIHLVDQVSGESVASRNEWAGWQHSHWLFGPDYAPIFLQWLEVRPPPETEPDRALWVAASLWRRRSHDSFQDQPLRASDHRALNETQVILGELVLPAAPSQAPLDPLADFANGFMLESAEAPAEISAGDSLPLVFSWRSAADGDEDLAQFLHLQHEESGEYFVYDQQPLGPRLPTRLWYTGLSDSETWRVPLPADLAPGRYRAFTGLYRQRDGERIPATDAEGRAYADARVELGGIVIEN